MRTDIVVRDARADEAAAISALAVRSKSHWGYDEEFLAACRAELTFSPEDCASGTVRLAVRGSRILGFHRCVGGPPQGELSALFIDLDAIGQGVGAVLIGDALDGAAARGLESLLLDADPGAEPFYAHFGARRIGESSSGSIPGRTLPRMRFDLDRSMSRSTRPAAPRIPPPAYGAAAALVQLVLVRGSRSSPASRATAAALATASAAVLGASAVTLHRRRTTVDPREPSATTTLVRTGVFGLSRNPIYLGMVGLLLAHAVGRRSWAGALGPALFVAVMDRTQIPAEERALHALFGRDFEEYAREVPRWCGARRQQREGGVSVTRR